MTKQFTNQQGKQFVFVEVPEDFDFAGLINGSLYYYSSDNQRQMNDYPLSIYLSKGDNYQIIGLAKDLTEEQWKDIVDVWEFRLFVNYEDDKTVYIDPIKSGLSLIQSLGFKPNANVLILDVIS